MSDALRRQHLRFEGVSGCAGDMFLGAALDLGVPRDVIDTALAALADDDGTPLGLGLEVTPTIRGGIAAHDVVVTARGTRVQEGENAHHHHHDGEQQHHHHRHYSAIRAQVSAAALAPGVTGRALDMFDRLARAEAALHGTTVDEVAFHELGALDALADIVGAAAALTWLAPVHVSSGPVHMGSGRVRTAHGMLPVPSPAALAVITEAGGLVAPASGGIELCTPTGAAILASAVLEWGPGPAVRPIATGYGAGDNELGDRPNVVRLTIGEPVSPGPSEQVVVIEANIDDMTPELCAHAASALEAAGALDVWWTAVTMKKSRPAWVLSVLAPAPLRAALTRDIFRETSTIGVRYREHAREVLEREVVTVECVYGAVEIKVARRDGEIINAAPEFDSVARRAAEHDVPAIKVYAAAVRAFEDPAS